MRALDKRSAFETARALGIPTPRTLVSDGSGEISEALRDQGIDYPLVVKPRLRGTRGGTSATTGKFWYRHTEA
jgi:carbamoylphosphate synthase large subunit